MFLRSLVRRFATSATEPLRKTPLYDFHIQNGGKMVPFAGYSMPLSYGDVGQVASHNHVRNSVGLFDVGHMVQSNFRGPTAQPFLEWLTPSALGALSPYSSTLSVLLNPNGGIIDDTIITKHAEDALYVVTNAGRRERDLGWFSEKIDEWNNGERAKKDGPVELEVLDGWGLVALQGPLAAAYLQSLTSFDLRTLTFGKSAWIPIDGGYNLHVARGGYTGEDGFEISIPPQSTEEVVRDLLSRDPVQLTGLGARDSLRLEAGMCLYGQDLDEETTPLEAGLGWVVGKERKAAGGFIGFEGALKTPTRRRVGLEVEGAPARQGAKIYSPGTDALLGAVTSGIPSPTLGKNIAMGYVSVEGGKHKKGAEVEVEVRGKRRQAKVVSMPFVPTGYWRG
ncbi:glycine cleavage system T protein [Armillaria solidipes]|uniref:Aminomethyltransferase n=1 Tax=Armillaria solidipes TaxID=1076256 RepID=A0A2H3B3T4_9AGAR|nr:glycine cleavage system T protein [Armillaria solidipes]